LKNLFTLLLLMVISWEVSAQETVIYFEDFGTSKTGGFLKDYNGFSEKNYRPSGEKWLISVASGDYGSFTTIGTNESELIFDFKDLLYNYLDCSVSFEYFRGASPIDPKPIKLCFSTDGLNWDEIIFPEQIIGVWTNIKVSIDPKYSDCFLMKIVKTGSNTTRIDNVRLTGILDVKTCKEPIISSGIVSEDNVLEVPLDSEITINCETPEAKIQYQINNGPFLEGIAPLKLRIAEDCVINAFATLEGLSSSPVNKSLRVLTKKERKIFTCKYDNETYALYPENRTTGTWLGSKQINTVDSELIINDLDLYWDVYESIKYPDSYYLYTPAKESFLTVGTGLFAISQNGTKWKFNQERNFYYCPSNIATITTDLTFVANKAPNNNEIYFSLMSVINSRVNDVMVYKFEECFHYNLNGIQNKNIINSILQQPSLKSMDLTSVTYTPESDNVEFINPLNPNCLVFTKGFYIFGNEVVNGECDYLVLSDNQPFSTPREFTALGATYSRMAWQDGGWETIILPYAVNTLPADYIFDEFAGISADNTQVTFRQVTSLEANKPYMMKYVGADKTNGQAKCTFTVSNVVISPEMQNTEFTGVYTKTPTAGKFILGVKNGETIFGKGGSKSYVNPFRAYLDITLDAQAGPMRVTHQPLDATGIEDTAEAEWYVWSGEPGEIVVRTPVSKLVNVVSVEGRLVRSVKMETGEHRIEGLSAGLYIVNGKKIVVK
ncbi:MAG: hypothetical protein RSF78_12180, partial [Bacteroidales bacterium]